MERKYYRASRQNVESEGYGKCPPPETRTGGKGVARGEAFLWEEEVGNASAVVEHILEKKVWVPKLSSVNLQWPLPQSISFLPKYQSLLLISVFVLPKEAVQTLSCVQLVTNAGINYRGSKGIVYVRCDI